MPLSSLMAYTYGLPGAKAVCRGPNPGWIFTTESAAGVSGVFIAVGVKSQYGELVHSEVCDDQVSLIG